MPPSTSFLASTDPQSAAAWLTAIVESSDDAIIGHDLDSIVHRWNRGAEKIFGYTAAEMTGTSFLRVIPAGQREEDEAVLARLRRGENVERFETSRLTKDGLLIEVAVSVSPVRDEAGRIVGVVRIVRDVTLLKAREREIARLCAAQEEAQVAERKVRSERDFSEAILNSLPGVVYLYDRSGRFLRWNKNFERVTGYSAAEIATMHPLDFFAGAEKETVAARIGSVFTDGEASVEADFVARGGRAIPYYFTGVLTRFEGQDCLVGVGIDLSAHRQVETALRESEERFNAFMDATPAITWITDAEGRHVFMNRAWDEALGLQRAEWLGKTAAGMVPPEVAERIRQSDLAVLEQDRAIDIPEAHGTLRGRPFYWDCVKFPFRNAAGQRFIGGIAIDITARKEAEAARHASEERYHTLFAQAPDGIVIADANSTYLDANDSICRMLGYTREELIGRNAADIVVPSEVQHIAPALSTIKGRGDYHREWRFRRKDGSVFPAEVIATMMPDGNLLGMIRDITDRKRAESALRELNETLEHKVAARTEELSAALVRAEAADQIKSAFLATMSHELRTPLNSIIGFTGIILQGLAGPLNPEQAKQLGMVRGSARHLLELINDVLDISKIEAGQLVVRAEAFDLPASLARVTASVKPLADKKGLELVTIVAPELHEMINDRRRVEQVLLNLLNNAIKFTEHGRVTLTAEYLADYRRSPDDLPGPAVRLLVTDTGIGIQPEDLPKLFHPFHQIDSGLTRSHEGTGLGLAICRRLVVLMSGAISVASEWAHGSVFTVTLPLHPPSTP
jgi:PAS domain S-box-containing protein